MTMTPVAAGGIVRRDINGNLVNLSRTQLQKYAFKIDCTDQESPGFAASTTDLDPIWVGDVFTLECIPQLGDAEQQTFSVMVVPPGWQINTDEYGADVGWSLNLEQV